MQPVQEEYRSVTQGDRRRVVIEHVTPMLDCGRFPVKRAQGEPVMVEADVFADGHDEIRAETWFRHESEETWRRIPMTALGNDRWRAVFEVSEVGQYFYQVAAGIDRAGTWRRDLGRRLEAQQDLENAFHEGARLAEDAATQAPAAEERARLVQIAGILQQARAPFLLERELALGGELAGLLERHASRALWRYSSPPLRVRTERPRARASAWYEFFPRSCAPSGRLRDCGARLRYAAELGFDVVYLPPIHPIGQACRKGPNNALSAGPQDPGSPWAIGGPEGGHTTIHPALGTLADFRALVRLAQSLGLELALDIAFQCAPDHPYVTEHPSWFRHRADGSVQYAENPPKRYQDIYPFDFESEDAQALWQTLRDIFLFWIGEGVRIFRVDNPHTKPLPFWEWVIDAIKARHPDVIFLAEAFTRPRVMERLAKLGFSQSYTYFTWRNSRRELESYFTELTQSPLREYFWPNAWPNTPDILPPVLQHGGRPAFALRVVLAATLCANYGIYGPAFELGEDRPLAPGSEEYLDSEKYQVRSWDVGAAHSLAPLLKRLNEIRRHHVALAHDLSLRFHDVDNEALICYSKRHGDSRILVVVNLDPHYAQSGWVHLDLAALALDPDATYTVHDLILEHDYTWHGPHNFVLLDPGRAPAHVLELRVPL